MVDPAIGDAPLVRSATKMKEIDRLNGATLGVFRDAGNPVLNRLLYAGL
jgi:hypothetical protein